MPDNLEDVKLKWESDNPSLIKVDSDGVVTVSDKASSGTTATITVIAADRGIINASCTVEVIEPIQEVPIVNSVHKIGKLSYKVTKSAETGGTVSCVKMNNKNDKKVNVPDTVNINGYTFKVTKIESNAFKSAKKLTTLTIGKNVTTIGKNVCKSAKKLKKITIKSTKLKSVGKGAFKSIHKKATITVPKKKLKKYKKMLKKAGCSCTVKGK
jgi:hypothetical protein